MKTIQAFDDLIEIEGNPKPKDMVCGTVATADRLRLRFSVTPSRLLRTRGTVIVLQGRNEAIEKYFETVEDLAKLGYCVVAFDWRGQGGSQRVTRDPTKGHISNFDAYLRDLDAIFREVVLPDCRGPYVILAHSMGASVALLGAPMMLNRVERIVASAPLVSLPGVKPRTTQLFLASNALRWSGLGGLAVRNQARASAAYTLARNPLTSDRRRFARNRALAAAAPQLFVGGPTAGWLAAATGAMRRLEDSDTIARFQIPALIVTAGEDEVVSSTAAERLAWRMRSGHSLDIAGARHEILQESDRFREPFMAAFEAFAGGAMPLD